MLTKLIVTAMILIILMGCSSPPPRTRNISLQEMLIDESKLPDNWAILEVSQDPILRLGHDKAIEMTFYYIDDPEKLTRGGITIYQFDRENEAVQSFSWLEKTFFNEDRARVTTPYYVPKGFNFTSTVANQWRFACYGHSFEGLFEDNTICSSLARYEEFVVDSDINTEYQKEKVISTKNLQSLFEAIDQQIATILKDQPSNQ